MSTLTVPAGSSYVAAALLSTVFLLLGQTVTVGKYRYRSGIPYPRAYAEKAEMDASPNAVLFNCAQRAHQNTLENLPLMYIMTLLTSVKYPILGASALGLWNPNKRTNALSVLHYPILLVLLGSSTYTVFQLVRAGI
ncbi:hypothetical protein B0H10DRAFT_2222840 [Mycena sp. CBHHK59/15]|nr:hypothetical protein B0H10DRAFT_2222840 [Mycena sp. CBHHK59/15]